ncbi:MAG TPA: BBP7 family outer membrane beta-barrel protein [Pirellulales bacterium]|nr:BBP7 family outer membrane beta-barrel protein [Pirellulales bacterium]
MTAYRAWTAMVGVLCLSGTALAQTNYLEANDPYGVRLTRLDYSTQPSLNYSGASGGQPVVGTPASARMQAPATAPQAPPDNTSSSGAAASCDTCNSCGGSYENALHNCGWGDECGCNLPSCCCNDHWYAYAGGLTMGRTVANRNWTTYDTANNAHQLLYFPGANWGGGVDTRIGYWFGCGCCGDPCSCSNSCGPTGRFGVEADYWGVWGMNGNALLTNSTFSLGTVQDDSGVSFGTNPATDWYDNRTGSPVTAVRLSRNDDINNVEVNFLYMPCCEACNRFQVTALAGIRYFNFRDNLTWDQFTAVPPAGSTSDEAIINANVTNNLVGFQLGAYLNYQICSRWSVFAAPKIGIYGNHITGYNAMALSDGTQATFDANGDVLHFNNSANVFSMLGSIDVGFNWAFSSNWSFIGGYRVVGVSGVALADNQIPQFFADEAGWKTIKTNGDLIVDGAFAGLECRF